jgi:integrase
MDEQMESNKYLWQPRKNGPIHIRVFYHDADGKRTQFCRSLRTSHWPTARKIRDAEFVSPILDVNKARVKLELILKQYPELVAQMQKGVHGGWGPDRDPAAPTIEALCRRWCEAISEPRGNYSMARRSALRYKTVTSDFVTHVGGDTLLTDITRDTVSAYRDERLQTYGRNKNTVDLEVTALRGMFRYGVDRMGMKENPADGVMVQRTKAERNREARASRRRVPTHEEADRVCTAFPVIKASPVEDCQDYALFARYTGMRLGEIAQLQADDALLFPGDAFLETVLRNPDQYGRPYRHEDGVPAGMVLCLYVKDAGERDTKTGLERVVPVADKLLPALNRRLQKARGKDGALFPAAVADRGAVFGRNWRNGVKKIHPELTMHGFRHYAASEMENNGVNRTVASAVLGHVENSVHGGYVHATIAALKEAVDRIH